MESFVIGDADPTPWRLRSFHYTSEESQRPAIRSVISQARTGHSTSGSDVVGAFQDTGSELRITRACYIDCYADVDMPEKSWSNSKSFRFQITYYAGVDRVPFVVAGIADK